MTSLGADYLNDFLRTVTPILWKSDKLVETVKVLQKDNGLFAMKRSIVLGLSKFLEHVLSFKFLVLWLFRNPKRSDSESSEIKISNQNKFFIKLNLTMSI